MGSSKVQNNKNCFVKVGFPNLHNETDHDDTSILDEEHQKSLQTGISFEEYVKCDDEILHKLVEENFQDVSSDEDDSENYILHFLMRQ